MKRKRAGTSVVVKLDVHEHVMYFYLPNRDVELNFWQ